MTAAGTELRGTCLPAPGPVPQAGPAAALTADEVIALAGALPPAAAIPGSRRKSRLRGVPVILGCLEQYPGGNWQERWLASGADRDTGGWLEEMMAGDPRAHAVKRGAMSFAVTLLLLGRVIVPGYAVLSARRSGELLRWTRELRCPDLFARAEQAGAELGMHEGQLRGGLAVLARMVLHTGRDIGQLTADDLFEHRAWKLRSGKSTADSGASAAWDMLARTGVFPRGSTMRASRRAGQSTAEALVGAQGIRSGPVRGVLARYLAERAPGLDYSTLRQLAGHIAGVFWADIELHHPDISTLQLPPEVSEAWKQRLRTWTAPDGTVRERGNYLDVMAKVRAFYLDIQEWAMEDPSWAQWAAPSPVRRSELAGMSKKRKQVVSRMHQRIRERLPHLQRLADSADEHRRAQARLLAAAAAVPAGQEFACDGTSWRRTVPRSWKREPWRAQGGRVLAEDIRTGKMTDITKAEEDAFWTWAVIETFRHTGIRAEELLEITQLAVVSYRLPRTGEAVPLLQIIPSKTGEERLLLVSPELASVLAAVVKRLRHANDGSVPLVARYDAHEQVTGPPLPHLFQRQWGWKPVVFGAALVKRMLNDALARAGITDAAGKPLRYTAHDFRRMFATEAVTGGLPVHIAAKILGHRHLASAESYVAVFQDDLVRDYRAFLARRRAVRPEAEYREPTADEWREFEEHFEKRKLELGTCGRPYGTPCQHEHACIRCPMLRPDPSARGRLAEIIRNLAGRISEARVNGWLGEVEGLQVSLAAARSKLAVIDRTARNASGTVDLGMPACHPPQQT